jgi:hypothetical protein
MIMRTIETAIFFRTPKSVQDPPIESLLSGTCYWLIFYRVTPALVVMRGEGRDEAANMVGAKPMLLWYVWIRLVDGAWHRLDEISKQLRLPSNAIEWAAKFLCDKGMAERGFEENEIRLHMGTSRFEDAVRALSSSTKSSK